MRVQVLSKGSCCEVSSSRSGSSAGGGGSSSGSNGGGSSCSGGGSGSSSLFKSFNKNFRNMAKMNTSNLDLIYPKLSVLNQRTYPWNQGESDSCCINDKYIYVKF